MHTKCGVDIRGDGTIHVTLLSGDFYWWFPATGAGRGHWKHWDRQFREDNSPPPPEVLTFILYLCPASVLSHVRSNPLPCPTT